MEEDRYKSIINNSQDFITLISKDYVYEMVNDTYCEGIQRQKEELLGARVAEVWGDEKFESTIKGYLDRCFAGEHVHYIDQFKFGPFMKYMHVSYYPYYESDEITHVIVFSHDITHIGKLESKLSHYEYRDPITGLFNRRSLDVILDKELERASRSKSERKRVLLFIELSNIEKVVELYSQEISDLILENSGQKIQKEIRSSDYIFRFDGYRFAVLLSRVSNKLDAAKVSEKIYQTVTFPYTFRGRDIKVGCAIGASIYPYDGENKEELVRASTSAMLEAQRSGKSFLLYNEEMHRQAMERLELESSAYRALGKQQFQLRFQPIVDCNRRIIGAEALLRWRHPEMGSIVPDKIIPLAEESGLIHAIGKWVLFAVCSNLAAWSRQFGIYISYNMSAREFSSPQVVENVHTALRKGGIDPHFLKIEITESTCMENFENTLTRIRELNKAGVELYIDDFGTGNSSLHYLKQLPAQVLKIDRCFLQGIEENENDLDFLRHIIEMVRTRGKEVIVEGVDSEKQVQLLSQIGCPLMQGFYFSKPVDAEDFVSMLHRGAPLP